MVFGLSVAVSDYPQVSLGFSHLRVYPGNLSCTTGVVSRTDALAALLSKRKSQMKTVEEERASIIHLEGT